MEVPLKIMEAAGHYLNTKDRRSGIMMAFVEGATSQAAREYWYKKYEEERRVIEEDRLKGQCC